MQTHNNHFAGIILLVMLAFSACFIGQRGGGGGKAKLPDAELIFIDSMLLHEQMATKLVRQAEQETKHSEIKELANHLAAEQVQENKQLNIWRQRWYRGASVGTHIHRAKIPAKDASQLSSNLDLDFVEQIAAHHQETIRISKQALENARQPEIKQFAQNTINERQKEIEKMEAWKAAWQKK